MTQIKLSGSLPFRDRSEKCIIEAAFEELEGRWKSLTLGKQERDFLSMRDVREEQKEPG